MIPHAYVLHANKLVVLWSPKCACTAVVEWFLHIAQIQTSARNKRWWLAENGYLYTYRQTRHLVEDLGYTSVQFTRDPYSRSVSAFVSKFCVYKGKPLTQIDDLEPFSKKFIQSYEAEQDDNAVLFRGLSFIAYLQHVQRLMEEHNVIDRHWDTQLPRDVAFRLKPDYIVRTEHFETDLQYVNSSLGFPDYIPEKRNATAWPEGFSVVEGDEAATNSLSILRNKKILQNDNLLNKTSMKLIRDIYQEDFLFFAYPMKKKNFLGSFFLNALKSVL